MKVTQYTVTILSFLVIFFSIYVIMDLRAMLSSPGFNPRDGQAGFVFIGIDIAKFATLLVGMILFIVNQVSYDKLTKNEIPLFWVNSLLVVVSGFLLLAYRAIMH